MPAADALTSLKADGTYDKLFEKFGMTRLTDDHFAIRGPGPDLTRQDIDAERQTPRFDEAVKSDTALGHAADVRL